MRRYWLWLVLAILVLGAAMTMYVGSASRLEGRITWLASQPAVIAAFQNSETASSDALTTLIAFAVLTPIAVFAAIVIIMLVVTGVATILVSLHLPGWLSAPLVAMATIVTMYTASESWLPASLYGIGLVARAYLVYSSNGPA